MGKDIHVRDEELLAALRDGADCLIAGSRRFLLVEVHDSEEEPYDLTNPEEIDLVRRALQDTRPPLSPEEARAYLKARRQQHGAR